MQVVNRSAPMDLGDIVSAAVQLYLRHLRLLLPMAALTGAGVICVSLGLLPAAQRAPNQPATAASPLSLALTPLVVPGFLLLFFNQIALVRFALEARLTGAANPLRCYLLAARVYPPVVSAYLLSALVVTVSAVVWILLPVALYFAVCWFFVAQVCLAEGRQGTLTAMRRSRQIVRGAWWRTAGVLAGILLLSLLPSLATGIVPSNAVLAQLIFGAIAAAIATPFAAAAQTLLYLDTRLRKHESISLTPGGPTEPLEPR